MLGVLSLYYEPKSDGFVIEVYKRDEVVAEVVGKGTEIVDTQWNKEISQAEKEALLQKVKEYIEEYQKGDASSLKEIYVAVEPIEPKYEPYCPRVAFFVVNPDDFDEILEAIDTQTTTYSYRELCQGEGYYLEFEPNVLECTILPALGDVSKLNVDIVQVWV